jgi:protein translocase SecG subunit
MFIIATLVMVLLGVLLIAAVLVQPGKGDMATGMSNFGSQLGTMFGSRRATDMLMKITIGLGAAIMLLSLVTNKFLLTTTTAEQVQPATVGAEKPMVPAQKPAPPVQQQGQPAPAQQNQATPQGK